MKSFLVFLFFVRAFTLYGMVWSIVHGHFIFGWLGAALLSASWFDGVKDA